MGKEWGLTSDDYSWIVTILYIGYILFHWVCDPFYGNPGIILRNQHANYILVDSCLDICPLATLDGHDGSRMGLNEHAPGRDHKFRRNYDTALPRWSIRGWFCPCCCPLHDVLLPSRRDGSSIWSLHLVLPTCQLLRFCPCIRPCSCQDVHTQLEAALSSW